MPRIPSALLDDLRDHVEGHVLTAEHPDFGRVAAVHNGAFTDRPALVVRAATTGDVVRAVALARESGLDLAVRSGGHSGAGHGLVRDGVVLDLRPMRELRIDPAARLSVVGPGITALEHTRAAGAHGLATGFGDTGSVGVSGIALGGGHGLLSRRYGLTVDSVLGAQVVTADGRVREVDARHEPDLFWALRGGGGNFGVVTRLRLRLHPVRPFLGGLLALRATAENLRGLVATARSAPRGLTAIVNAMRCPPLPFLPERVHGQPVLLAMVAWVGGAAAGEDAIGPLRRLDQPLVDTIAATKYASVFPPEPPGPAMAGVGRGLFLDRVDAPAAERIVRAIQDDAPGLHMVQVRILGGAIDDVAPEHTAFGFRGRRILASVGAAVPDVGELPTARAWVDALAARLDQGVPGCPVNFLGPVDPQDARRAYPERTWERLRDVKTAYDPANLFHVNHNIPPRGAGA